MPELTQEEKDKLRMWLSESFQAVQDFDGSEASEERLFYPLSLFDEFVRAQVDETANISDLERKVSEIAFPEHPVNMPLTVDGFLDTASEFYERLINIKANTDIFTLIENAGGVVQNSEMVFVKTDDGHLQVRKGENPQDFEVKTEPRLAALIAHLRNDGVKGQSIYMDDLVINRGQVSDTMMREYPYNIVQIPRLDVEIAVCDQVGETTFVKKGTVGAEFWDHMSKEQLKSRDDVSAVNRYNDQQWWEDISKIICDSVEPDNKKVVVNKWINKAENLDIDLVKASLLAHRLQTGIWLNSGQKAPNGGTGSYILEHGPYAGMLKAGTLNAALKNGSRGLPSGLSITSVTEEISEEQGIEYVNRKKQAPLDIDLIKESLLAHRQATGEWLAPHKRGKDGNSYILEHGPYAKKMTANALQSILSQSIRGIEKQSSIAKLNAEISEEHGLDYINKNDKDDLDIDLIKESLLAHRQETGEWLRLKKSETEEPYKLEYGPYATQETINSINIALARGTRGLSGGSSIAKLNAEISEEHGLDYSNHLNQNNLHIDLIKESLLAHRQATGEWLSNGKLGDSGTIGGYVLEHGPYAGELTVTAMESALTTGGRGLSGGSSIAKLNAEISEEHGLDYKNNLAQELLDIDLIKESLLAHRQATGEWLSSYKKDGEGRIGGYILEHGPYAGTLKVGTLNAALQSGIRGLMAEQSIASVNSEVSEAHDLDYKNKLTQEFLDIDLIKESLLAHRQNTGKWLSSRAKGADNKPASYILEHGPYAGEINVRTLDGALRTGQRGLTGGSSIAKLHAEISEAHDLDYRNIHPAASQNNIHDNDLDLSL
ncbi:MAG: hypothetical protein ACRBB3_10365 [Alphaproteobacteria bacterium]